MSIGEHWERQAAAWAAWARTPGHDSYELVRDRFFDEIVPPPGRATLEVGCGEGRVCRDLAARGHRVTGVDSGPTLVALAREADPASEYIVADAAALPFADASFDLAVSYNALMNLDELDGPLREVARVLGPDGALALCIVHPLAPVFRRHGESFLFEGSYYDRRDETLTVTRDGLTMTFVDRRRTLEDYVRAIAGAGLIVDRIGEVSDDDPPVRPQFLFMRARRRAP